MRKVIAITIMIILAILLYMYIGNVSESNRREENLSDNLLTEEDILSNIDTNYDGIIDQMKRLQTSPEQITRFHCMLTQMIYSGTLEENQIQKLVELERESYGKDVLELNPIEFQVNKLKKQLEEYSTYGNNGLKVIAYETVGAEYWEDGIAIVKVVYYFNLTNFIISDEASDGRDDNGYIGYVLKQNEEGLWEVVGFEPIEPFTIIKE